MVRHPGEDPGQEAADQRPAGCLEVQPGRQPPERAWDASDMRTVSSADGPTPEWGYTQRAEREAQSEGREEEQPTRLGTPVEAARRVEARAGREDAWPAWSGGSETWAGRRGRPIQLGRGREAVKECLATGPGGLIQTRRSSGEPTETELQRLPQGEGRGVTTFLMMLCQRGRDHAIEEKQLTEMARGLTGDLRTDPRVEEERVLALAARLQEQGRAHARWETLLAEAADGVLCELV